jgi:23S rRNA pseudouridine1911/1915/1917 synthase
MTPPEETLRFAIGEDESGQRVDVALASLAAVSRAQIQRWIGASRVRVNGRECRPSLKLAAGDCVVAVAPEPVAPTLTPENLPLDILYEDDDLIVVAKPAGMVVHPSPGHLSGTLVHALLYHCGNLAGVGGVLRPGIVHRLDRGTSGVLVAAKNDTAHRALADQFRDHTIERVYHAVVRGLPKRDGGRIDRPIGRHPRDRTRMAVRRLGGRSAATDWTVKRRFVASGVSQLEVRPETGRTHQIRVHLASAGLPILGDPVYGTRGGRRSAPTRRTPSLDRPALHAALLAFDHPRGTGRMRFEAAAPADLAGLIERLTQLESSS